MVVLAEQPVTGTMRHADAAMTLTPHHLEHDVGASYYEGYSCQVGALYPGDNADTASLRCSTIPLSLTSLGVYHKLTPRLLTPSKCNSKDTVATPTPQPPASCPLRV